MAIHLVAYSTVVHV